MTTAKVVSELPHKCTEKATRPLQHYSSDFSQPYKHTVDGSLEALRQSYA